MLIPKGGTLAINYDVTSDTKLPLNREAVVQQVLEANEPIGSAGRFRLALDRGGQMLHVIPTVTRSASGALVPQEALLDASISLSGGDRNGLQTLEAICEAVSQAKQTQVVVGTIPVNLLVHHRDSAGALNQKARDVLAQTLERAANGVKLSWQLLYDPGMKVYFLNIHPVPTPKESVKE